MPATDFVPKSLTQTLAELTLDPESAASPEVQKAVQLARILQKRGTSLQTSQERRQQRELERMMDGLSDRATLMQLTDQAFRSTTPKRVANQLIHILDVQGIPRFFSTLDRAMLKGFQSFGGHLPGVSIPMVKSKMREETANVVLPAESELLVQHLRDRSEGGLRMNVNYLGEALLGEDDATERLQTYLAALQLPEIDCISVKVSTVYSQIFPIARDKSIRVLCDRMELLYRASAKATFTRPDGAVVPKFVYLDMEEYRDLDITSTVFMQTLDRPGLEGVNAGIALQAYLPDSYEVLRTITEWSQARVAKGGSPVTVRIVKGANMEAEKVEASIEGWPQAPYTTKRETDANYKRMLRFALQPEHVEAVRVGVASHNLFDVSYGLVVADAAGVIDKIQFEMLEGIANHQRRALHELVDNVLLYAPATRKEDFVNAIGYLIRRLDENTGPENFLRHAFSLEVGSDVWNQLEKGFVDSFGLIESTTKLPRRTQDRRESLGEWSGLAFVHTSDFVNEPDTDFSLLANVEWAKGIRVTWQTRHGADAVRIPLVIAGEETHDESNTRACTDPSRPELEVAYYCQASNEDIDRAIDCARKDPSGWRTMSEDARLEALSKVAHQLRVARADLMGAALLDGGKIFTESDPEISEAIDFVEYYALTARDFRAMPSIDAKPAGVVVVVPPWNFPAAIPCGGIAAALAAGNTVILKPASQTVLVAYEVCKCFWRAGISKEALQFVPCSGATGGARLVASDDVDIVILTGGTDTALRMLDVRPGMNLLAETGGKNATIVTAMSDREQAIKHVVGSAFGHAGQKCSATSLLILEAEVYDDPTFKKTLCDMVESLEVGSAHEFSTKMGPMIVPPDGDLERSQKELETGESWAVRPGRVGDNPNLWSPGVKWGVRPGSYTHMTEFFGPMLAVLRADTLSHAIELVNQTGYGLTSGLESLDGREQAIWREQMRAGNLYINRGTTGAIVLRQPFGGMGKSAFGPGIKAGGPNYVAQLMQIRDTPTDVIPDSEVSNPDVERLRQGIVNRCKDADGDAVKGVPIADLRRVLQAVHSYDAAFESEFALQHDSVRLLGQDNHRRYLPVPFMRIRVHKDDSAFEVFAQVCAARIAGCRITLSSPVGPRTAILELLDVMTDTWGGALEFVEESDEALADIVQRRQTDRIRYASLARVPEAILRAVGDTGIYIARAPVLAEGRVELLWYLKEQSISHDYHRYGNLGTRGEEERRPVL
tara:strand:- start:9146 stop:12841 length:3696 start_codon:yes stop_codon:yes gene_type:complete